MASFTRLLQIAVERGAFAGVEIIDGVSTIAGVGLPPLATWPDNDGLYGVVDTPLISGVVRCAELTLN